MQPGRVEAAAVHATKIDAEGSGAVINSVAASEQSLTTRL
jgi:hypothetical protein